MEGIERETRVHRIEWVVIDLARGAAGDGLCSGSQASRTYAPLATYCTLNEPSSLQIQIFCLST